MREVFIMERNRFARDGWEFIHIEGAPFDRGVSYGRLMAKEITNAIREVPAGNAPDGHRMGVFERKRDQYFA